MARVKFIRDEEPNILALSSNKKVIDGALYVATDTGSMWLGVAENRLLQINAANLDKDTTYTIHKSGNTIFFQDSNGTVTKITDDNTIYDDATDTTAGLMSAADKAKLDGIAASIGTKADTSALEKEVSDRKAADTYLGSRIDNAISQGLTVIKTTSTATNIGADALAKLIKSWPQVILVRTDQFGNENGLGFMYPLKYVNNKYYFYSPKIRNNVDSKPYYVAVKISNNGEGTMSNVGLDMAPIYWVSITHKPFVTIGSGLKVVSGTLTVDTSELPSGLTTIAVGETSTADDVYAKVQAAWPNCVLSGDALYYPYTELPAVGSQAHSYLFTANGGGATFGWIVNATSMTHISDIMVTGNTTWGEIEQP